MIRAPVDRIVSLFHFLRRKSRFKRKPIPPQEWFMKDFDNCVISGDLECQVKRQFLAAKKQQAKEENKHSEGSYELLSLNLILMLTGC